MWYGGHKNRLNPDAQKYLPKIRQLLAEKKFTEAERLSEMALYSIPPTQNPYQKLSDLILKFHEGSAITAGKATDYYRDLNIETGIARVIFKVGKTTFTREMFCSAVDNVLVVRLTSDQPKTLSLQAHLERNDDGHLAFLDRAEHNGLDQISSYGQCGPDGVHYRVAVKAVIDGGEMTCIGEYLDITDATSITLYLTSETSHHFPADELPAMIDGILARAAKESYDTIKDAHLSDHLGLFQSVKFQLNPSTPDLWHLPTNIRLNRMKQGSADLALIALYYQYGRYLLMASSRPGSLPANLQGIWCDSFDPPWGSKYTININTEMNYWLAEPCGLSECHIPLLDHLKRMEKTGKITARKMYDCAGWVCHHNTNSWGDTAPVDRWSGAIWPMASGWLCTHLWEHYLFAPDKEFLENTAYPLIKGAVEFYAEYLIMGPKGTLQCGPSISPENSFITKDGQKAYITMEATMDRQIIWELFGIFIKMCEILGSDTEMVVKIKDLQGKLPPMKIGQYGQLQEWGEDYAEAVPGHRHMSHLWGLHPGKQISIHKTPELAQATKITLFRRLTAGGGHTGWSCAWIINFWARLAESELAAKYIHTILTNSTLPNLFDNHPPFQIDGNFGATAGITEMLLQSHEDEINLLPCLPLAWADGEVTGLKARGQYTVNIVWEEGKLLSAEIIASQDGPCRLRTPYLIQVSCDEKPIAIKEIESGVVEFSVAAGKTYSIKPR